MSSLLNPQLLQPTNLHTSASLQISSLRYLVAAQSLAKLHLVIQQAIDAHHGDQAQPHHTQHESEATAMADVEMTDAPKAKSSKAGPSGDGGENKPRFEVKKVPSQRH
jgi:hypothetical protein